MLSLILVAALNAAVPPVDKPPLRMAGSGCTPTTLQLAADGPQPAQPAPCPKPYLMAGPGKDSRPAVPPAPLSPGEAMDRWDPGFNIYTQPVRCGRLGQEVVQRVRTASGARRGGGVFLAVERQLDGCAVPTPINYRPDYLLPGAADPVRRGDAPADRR